MRRLIAHIGLHKTGTTAFQQWVTDHRAPLAAAGIHVPSVGMMDAGNHRPLIEAIYRCDEGILDAFQAAVPTAGDVMISSEWLTSPAGLLGVSHLAALADRYTMERHAILVVRDEAELLVSFYVQQRQSLRLESPDYDTYLQDIRRQGRFDVPAILRTYAKAGFRVEQVPYADAKRVGIVEALARLPLFDGRLEALIPPAVTHENTSFGAAALIVCDLVRRVAIEHKVRLTSAVRRTLRSSIAAATQTLPYERFEPGRSPLTVGELPAALQAEVQKIADEVACNGLFAPCDGPAIARRRRGRRHRS